MGVETRHDARRGVVVVAVVVIEAAQQVGEEGEAGEVGDDEQGRRQLGVKRVPAVVKKPEDEGDGGLQEQEGNVGEVHGAAIFVPVTLAADADRRRDALVQVVLRDAGDVGVIVGTEARMAVELFCTTARADGELLAAREGKDIGQYLPAPLRADAVAVIEGQPLGIADDERRTRAAAEVEPEGAAQ